MNIDAAKVFSTLGNPTRLRCLYLLARNEEVCVCDVVDALEVAQPSASKALNNLKAAGLLSLRRDANWVYYRLRPDLPAWLAEVVESTASALDAEQPHKADQDRLAAAPRRCS